MQTFSPQAVIEHLQNIVGRSYVLTDDQSTRQYRQGRRFGEGKVLAVVVPGTLLEQWQVLQAAIEADCIVIMQAANTGLTGGSTPYGDDYDRPVLVMSTRRLKGIQVIHDGKQVICLPGATLDNLEQILKGYNREPHSVIGSACIRQDRAGGHFLFFHNPLHHKYPGSRTCSIGFRWIVAHHEHSEGCLLCCRVS